MQGEREWVSEDVRSEPTLIPQHKVVIQGAKLLGGVSPLFSPKEGQIKHSGKGRALVITDKFLFRGDLSNDLAQCRL